MTRYLLLSLFFLSCITAYAASDIIVYPHGIGKAGVYIPGFRTYSGSAYSTSDENVAFLRELRQDLLPVRIAGFGTNSPGQTSLSCRLSYPVYLPGKVPYEVYLAEAMRAELLEAGLYSEAAPVGFTGHLISIDFNSFGTGKWNIEATFSLDGGEPITIKHEHTYSVAGGAVYACNDVSRALVPAIQGFLKTVYADQRFVELLRSAAGISNKTDTSQTARPLP